MWRITLVTLLVLTAAISGCRTVTPAPTTTDVSVQDVSSVDRAKQITFALAKMHDAFQKAVADAYLDKLISDDQLKKLAAIDAQAVASRRTLVTLVQAWETGRLPRRRICTSPSRCDDDV
jgi:hypothetical protein